MKKNQYLISIIIILSFSIYSLKAQQINVNGNVSIQQLIEDNFVDGCVEVSNITSFVNGNANGFRSYAEFTRGSSNFPFENGIMLSTGSAESGGNNLTTTTLSEGAATWGTDPDLEMALGITNTLNATSIEFDFVSISNQVQFNYLLASEEYSGINPCNVSDGFAFLIREAGTSLPYQNIAVVPGTNTPVNTNTVHDEIVGVCSAQNDQFFDGYNIGDTNYNGRTEVLTATTTITPYVRYHVKLVIADFFDNEFDSAVFIEGDSFKILDLGDDIDTCAQSVRLNADIQNPSSTYEWFFNANTSPIPGQNNPTLDVTQSGTYTVEITTPLGTSSCVEEDEIVVNIQTELTLAPLTDYLLCDDLSGDEVEIFNLSTKDVELLGIIPFTNRSFSYHLSDSNARNDINPITNPIQNSALNQPIFIRINDLDTGCVAYSTFNLVLNTIPNITTPTNLEVCDTDNDPSDGITIIDLSEKDDEITIGDTNLLVSYHYNSIDATNGNNEIPRPFVGDENTPPYINNNTPTETLYVRVLNSVTGCFTTTQLTIDVTNGPIVNRDPFPLDACDRELDGTATFDLTTAISDILNGLTNVTTSFHENFGDAETNSSPIADETNYENVVSDVQTIYVRVEDNTTGCASIVPLEIHTNLLLTGTDTGDFALCDDPSNDGIIEFNLNVIERYILDGFVDENGDLPVGYEVTFYETEDDRDNQNNNIDKNIFYSASNPTTLYIEIRNNNCSEVDEINLRVDPILIFSPIDPVPYCDNDDDGIVSIDLSSFDDIVTGGNTNFTPTYFGSQSDADNNFDTLPPFYTNTQPQETIFVRLENIATGCFSVNSFDVEVIAAPSITQPDPWLICDTDGDALDIVNLNTRIPDIVSDTSGLSIAFFTSQDNAENNRNEITTLTNYQTGTQNIYVRIESIASDCYTIVIQEIIVNTLPIVDNIPNFQLCEDDNDQTTNFLFSDWDAEILNGQTGKEVFYFVDATLTIPIDKNTLYPNTSSPQTIYTRVENVTDPNCNATASFLIEVGANPVYNDPGAFLICDDASNDGIEEFDFNIKINEISQSSTTNLSINFFQTEQDAIDNNGVLPLNYTNTQNPEQIYVRIENTDSECVIIEAFGINVVAAPDLSDNAEPMFNCDDDYDGITLFNLNNAEYENFDRFSDDITVNYFENLEDVDDDALAIPNPDTYNSNSKTIYLKVTNNQTTCYTAIPITLNVLPLPVVNFDGVYPICDNESNTFNLSTIDDVLVNDANSVTISYFDDATNAENNIGALDDVFNYTASNHVFFTRIESLSNECVTFSSFTLQVNNNPIANTPQDLIKCDDDDDGLLIFDLTEVNNDILGSQPESDFNITYYNQLIDAENDENRLSNSHESANDVIIYARIENINTGCFTTTQFNTFINPLPIIPLNDIETLCLDDLPLILDASTGNPNDTYLWSSIVNPNIDGSNSPIITINNASELGEYTVTITTMHNNAENCTDSKTITVIQSEQATITGTAIPSFTDPNTITVTVSGIGNYLFTLDDGEPQTSNIFENVAIGPHTVTIEDLNGCSPVTTEVFVIDIPKFITPNGDGSFDTWHIVGADMLPGSQVFIYNRHGKLIKMLPHTSLGWDGTYNGKNMPADDYWFTADIIQDGESFRIKGHFALKR